MNKAQKAVQKASLNDEKKTIRELKQVYGQAKKDVEERIKQLSMRTDMENLQSIIYQKKYQEALKKQIDDVLDKLNTGQFNTVSDYLNKCYENGYIGNMYDLQHQGIPMTVPINQKKVVKALQTDTKLSSRKYKGNPLKGRLAEDVDFLKLKIRAELSRSVANGSSWNEVAVKIAKGMNNPFDVAYRNALLIARTEGHRIQQSATLDAMHVAKDKGADVVKQWDSTMDRKTRKAHMEADGQIRELDEPFDVWGEKMDAPAVGGSAKNVCNCRCVLLQRARWALDEDELKTLQEKAEFFGLDKSQSFEEFRQKYLNLPENIDTIKIEELSSVWGANTFDELETYMEKTYGIPIDQSVKVLNFNAVQESTAGIEQIIKEFPQAKDVFKGLSTDKSGVMCATFRGKICFNPSYYSDFDKVFNAMTQAVSQTGFHPKGNNLFSTGSHEAGHILELALNMKANGSANPFAWSKCTYAQEIVSEASKNAKKTPEGKGKKIAELIGDVSGYAKTNRSEALAECVADYVINGEKSSLLSREVWKILKRELG